MTSGQAIFEELRFVWELMAAEYLFLLPFARRKKGWLPLAIGGLVLFSLLSQGYFFWLERVEQYGELGRQLVGQWYIVLALLTVAYSRLCFSITLCDALYIGISNYNRVQTEAAVKVFRALKTPFILNQVCYNMLDRTVEENGLKAYAEEEGFSLIVYSPLAQGLLTERYTHGIPDDSRMRKSGSLKEERLTPELLQKLSKLREIAAARGQTLPELALSWALKDKAVASVIIGASSSEQIKENIKVDPSFTAEELAAIDAICKG